MKNHKCIMLALALALGSCASVTSQADALALKVTVVEIPSYDDQPTQHLLTGTYGVRESIPIPKCITIEGTRGSMFVGTSGANGEATGFQIEFIVENAMAIVSGSRLRDGKVVAHEEHSVPVTPAD